MSSWRLTVKKLTGGVIHINVDNPRVRLYPYCSEAVRMTVELLMLNDPANIILKFNVMHS